jgi:hypothetical protein
MSLLKQTWRVLGAIAVLALAPMAKAQQEYLPLAEPMEFNPDWQWFAPVDVDELSQNSIRKRGNYGWFVSHDRMRIWVKRPDTRTQGNNQNSANNFAGDFVLGQRTDLGFVRENGSGWLVNYSKLTNLDIYHGVATERINRLFTDDPIGGTSTLGTSNGFFLGFPESDRNDPRYQARVYSVKNSLNAGRYYNLEVNKTWRRTPYRYGGVLEPLVGMKFANFTDLTQRQSYSRSLDSFVTPGTSFASHQVEQLQSNETTNLNRLLGGQIGARYFNNYHRWRVGAEFRTFLAANFQTSTETKNTTLTEYAGAPAIDVAVVAEQRTSVLTYETRQRTVWGFEARADAAYQMTKYLGLRTGVQVINLANGIRRGGLTIPNTRDDKDQNVFMAGVSVGLELNR